MRRALGKGRKGQRSHGNAKAPAGRNSTGKSVGKGGEADLIESVTHHIRGMDKQSGFPSIFRKPIRVTITLPHNIYNHLKVRSDEEGRSLSNLAAFLLEQSLN
jgi:hypothetical protein